jgi:hypothetical protein
MLHLPHHHALPEQSQFFDRLRIPGTPDKTASPRLPEVQAALSSAPTTLPMFCSVFCNISRMSCSEVTQKFSCRSVTAFRVMSRSWRKLRSRERDILAPRYLTSVRGLDLFT